MSEEPLNDEQSHYEISLTAGQAFVAFVFLLLSLAAAFAFGLMIGRGQADERLVVRKEPAVITEASAVPKKDSGKIVELGVPDEGFKPQEGEETNAQTSTAPPPTITEENPPPATQTAATSATPAAAAPVAGPVYAQILSTGDQKTAETLAAKLIDSGFPSAYVERGSGEKGPVFRVRVKFSSEADARAAVPKLNEFSKDVWITKQ
ncbi:MAG TPA: SPOR domain-containing protein [Thermoanaerobaculia bacterium]|nr:SPOR domain-containing protein [Thermoanaerobaculia bacterium]